MMRAVHIISFIVMRLAVRARGARMRLIYYIYEGYLHGNPEDTTASISFMCHHYKYRPSPPRVEATLKPAHRLRK